jgi:hypothetical protein
LSLPDDPEDDPHDDTREALAEVLSFVAEHAELAARAYAIRDDVAGHHNLRRIIRYVRSGLALAGDLEEFKQGQGRRSGVA